MAQVVKTVSVSKLPSGWASELRTIPYASDQPPSPNARFAAADAVDHDDHDHAPHDPEPELDGDAPPQLQPLPSPIPPPPGSMEELWPEEEDLMGPGPSSTGPLFEDINDDITDMLRIQRLGSEDILYEDRIKPPKIVGKYLFGELVGEGSYGKVKECLDVDQLTRRAVKIMKKRKLRRIPGGVQNVETEIRLLRKLRHPNVIELVETFERADKGKLYVVMNYCVGSLQEMVESTAQCRFPIWQMHGYFGQLTEGLTYLHSKGIVHKDVKPGNLLLDVDECLKITDFGVAEEFPLFHGSDLTRLGQGTPKFQAPEIASGTSSMMRAFPLDCWSAGVTLYYLISGKYPFDGDSILKLYEDIVQSELQIPTDPDLFIEPLLETFLKEILHKDPEQRLTLEGIRNHGWMRKKPAFSRLDKVALPAFKGDADRSLTVYPHLLAMFECSADVRSEQEGGDAFIQLPRASHNAMADFENEVPHSESIHRGQGVQLARLAAQCAQAEEDPDDLSSNDALHISVPQPSRSASSAPTASPKGVQLARLAAQCAQAEEDPDDLSSNDALHISVPQPSRSASSAPTASPKGVQLARLAAQCAQAEEDPDDLSSNDALHISVPQPSRSASSAPTASPKGVQLARLAAQCAQAEEDPDDLSSNDALHISVPQPSRSASSAPTASPKGVQLARLAAQCAQAEEDPDDLSFNDALHISVPQPSRFASSAPTASPKGVQLARLAAQCAQAEEDPDDLSSNDALHISVPQPSRSASSAPTASPKSSEERGVFGASRSKEKKKRGPCKVQ